MLVCVFVFVCVCTRTCVSACVKYIHAYTNTYSQTYQRARARAHTHTHTTGFEEEADLSEQAKVQLSDRLGLCALLKKIDKVFCKHLNDHWVPKEVIWGVYYNKGDFT